MILIIFILTNIKTVSHEPVESSGFETTTFLPAYVPDNYSAVVNFSLCTVGK